VIEPDMAVRLTIWAATLAWVSGEWRRGAPGASATSGRTAWTAGAVAALVHAMLAFHVHHAWSHAAALADTARQTAAVTGLDWGGGLYVNYAFITFWTADVAWWWRAAASFARRPAWLDAAIRLFLWFMFVNGAFLFVRGPRRWAGAAAAAAVGAAWYRGRGRKDVGNG
jgi:hypothetical protein